MRHGRLVRMLGSIDRTGRIMEQSAMDLLRPERLVFGYERLMLAAFALVPEPRSALLLGLGGGAMSRHLAAYLPDCAVTVVEREPVMRAIAAALFPPDAARGHGGRGRGRGGRAARLRCGPGRPLRRRRRRR